MRQQLVTITAALSINNTVVVSLIYLFFILFYILFFVLFWLSNFRLNGAKHKKFWKEKERA